MTDREKEKAEKGVDSVTDYVEAKEMGDHEKLKASLADLQAETQASSSSSVVIRREDIDLIADECDLSKERAEILLRKYLGNVQEAIAAFIKGE